MIDPQNPMKTISSEEEGKAFAQEKIRDNEQKNIQYLDELNKNEAQVTQQLETDKKMAEDPFSAKEAKDFGVAENAKEAANILTGIGYDTVDDLLSSGKNIYNFFTGQTESDGESYSALKHMGLQKYEPLTKTKWGNIIRGVGSFVVPGMALTKLGKLARISKGVGMLGKLQPAAKALRAGQGPLKSGVPRFLARGGLKGGVIGMYNGDLVEKANFANSELVQMNPILDTVLGPLAIEEDIDSPLMIRLKNLTLDMGMGGLFDLVGYGVAAKFAKRGVRGKPEINDAVASAAPVNRTERQFNSDAVAKVELNRQLKREVAANYKMQNNGKKLSSLSKKNQLAEMILFAEGNPRYKNWSPDEDALSRQLRKNADDVKNIEDQRFEAGKEQLQDPQMRGEKNYPMAELGQGETTPTVPGKKVLRQLNRIDEDIKAADGSVSDFLTTTALRRIASSAEMRDVEANKFVDDLMQDPASQREIGNLQTVRDLLLHEEPSLRRMARVASQDDSVEPLDYWSDYLEARGMADLSNPDTAYTITSEIKYVDALIGTNIKRLQGLSTAAREMKDSVDILKIDSLYDNIRNRIKIGVREAKRSRYLASTQLSAMKDGSGVSSARIREKLAQIDAELEEELKFIDRVVKEGKSPQFIDGLLEVLSQPGLSVRNVEDLLKFARRKISGYDGQQGLAMKEAGMVMANSVLSGPKTPVRAILGTGQAAFMRPLTTILGASMKGDWKTSRATIGELGAMLQGVPEATKYFFSQMGSRFSGDIANETTRFAARTKGDANWEFLGEVMNGPGSTQTDQIAYGVANIMRGMNNNKLLSWSQKVMASGDDAFKLMIARGAARRNGILEAMDKNPGLRITSKMLGDAEKNTDKFLLDNEGLLKSDYFSNNYKEATLTKELRGFSKNLETLFNKNPWAKPFFLFARTGVNGLELTAKNTPLVNLLVDEQRAILTGNLANKESAAQLAKFGIRSADDLASAKALMLGRQTVGTAVVFMAAQKFMNGELRGNGPPDRQRQRMWRELGGDQWSPRQIKIGNAWVGFDQMEPYGTILQTIADIGDASQQMGPEWTENKLRTIALVVGQSVTSKSYLQGLKQLTDVISTDPGMNASRLVAGIMNNQLPLAGLRNEMGKLLNPYMKEVNTSILEQWRSRNQGTEFLSGDKLPIKYDLLSGDPIQEWDFPTRMFNMFNPFSLNLEMTPGRELLFTSGYDMNPSVTYAPIQGGSVNLKDHPKLRSMFMREIGREGLDKKLSVLARDPKILQSIQRMEDSPQGMDPMSFPHNQRIHKLLETARARAWARVSADPDAATLIRQTQLTRGANVSNQQGRFGQAQGQYYEALNLKNK